MKDLDYACNGVPAVRVTSRNDATEARTTRADALNILRKILITAIQCSV